MDLRVLGSLAHVPAPGELSDLFLHPLDGVQVEGLPGCNQGVNLALNDGVQLQIAEVLMCSLVGLLG